MAIYRQNLNEVYIGREVIQPLFNQFKVVRDRVKNMSWSDKINVDKELIKYNRMVEQFFGFNAYCLVFVPDESMNASSLTMSAIRNKDELKRIAASIKSGKTGFKFDPSKIVVNATTTCNMGLIDRDIFTDEEVFAIFLHEYGHCFFEAIEDKDSEYTLIFYGINVCKAINNTVKNIIKGRIPISSDMIKRHVDNILKDNPISKIMQVGANGIKSIGNSVKRFFIKEDNSVNLSKKNYLYSNEKFADTFATMYGYGAELHSALYKSNKDFFKFYGKNYYSKTNPLLDWLKLQDLISSAFLEYIAGIADEHPNNLLRINISIQYIRRELSKKNLDPKMKLQLVAQLNELQKLVDEYNDNSGNTDYMYVLNKFYVYLAKKCNGDYREKDVDNDALFDTMDDRYNETLEQ